jgi:glutaredoxin 3
LCESVLVCVKFLSYPGSATGTILGAKETAMPEIEIYTQPWCPYCARAVSLLTAKGVTFREINAQHGSAEREESIRRSSGRTTVPQIFIGGRHIGGCDDLMALDRAGKLDPLLQAG